MTRSLPDAPPAAEAEILLLIERLRVTDERLDELLGGEVDSVTDSRGRTLLLQRAQGEVRQDEMARQSAILNALPACIALLDGRGRVVSVNASWRAFGTTDGLHIRHTAVGDNYLSLCDRVEDAGTNANVDDAHVVAAGIRAVLAGSMPTFFHEYAGRSPGSANWFAVRITRLAHYAASGVVMMHSDVSARRQAADALAALNSDLATRIAVEAALRGANKDLESFAYAIAHDLRSPLGVVAGFTRLLTKDLGPSASERQMHLLSRITAGVGQIDGVSEGLLALTGLARKSFEPELTDLSRIAHEAAALLTDRDPERRVDVHIQEGVVALCDRRMMLSLLGNLLGNAWKFSAKVPAARIGFSATASHDAPGVVSYHVYDNGAGFDMKYAQKLFVPFQRLHVADDFEGTGIGLATVRQIIERHGGSISAQGEANVGATFTFTLCPPPAAQA